LEATFFRLSGGGAKRNLSANQCGLGGWPGPHFLSREGATRSNASVLQATGARAGCVSEVSTDGFGSHEFLSRKNFSSKKRRERYASKMAAPPATPNLSRMSAKWPSEGINRGQ
jgi:hypothetical protein